MKRILLLTVIASYAIGTPVPPSIPAQPEQQTDASQEDARIIAANRELQIRYLRGQMRHVRRITHNVQSDNQK